MKRAVVFVIAGLVSLGGACADRAAAQDASSGCKVLLCAAATAPSWSGIPYCVPVMQQLFSSLAHGGGWPTSPEGNASGLGYELYQACPGATTPVLQDLNDAGLTQSPNGNLCADLSKPQQSCSGGDVGCTTTYPTAPRALNLDPYYVDISTANGAQRFYFSLQGY
jgi:hypothetical protein